MLAYRVERDSAKAQPSKTSLDPSKRSKSKLLASHKPWGDAFHPAPQYFFFPELSNVALAISRSDRYL